MQRKDLDGEIWKQMAGFEGLYEISSMGRVWSVKRPHPAVKTGQIVRGRADRRGYIKMRIGSKSYAVHRLVLQTFAGPPRKGQEAAHCNGIRSDNRLENLRWASRKENMADKKDHGTHWIGVTHKAARLTAEQVGELRSLRLTGWRWDLLADRYNIGIMTACAAGLGRTYSDLNKRYPPAKRGRRYNRRMET